MRRQAYMTSGDNLIFAVPDKAVKRQETGRDVQHCTRGLLRRTRVHDGNTAIVTGEGKSVTTRGEANTLNPASGVVQEFTTDSVEGEALAPGAGLGTGIDTLDKAGEDARVGVGRASSK